MVHIQPPRSAARRAPDHQAEDKPPTRAVAWVRRASAAWRERLRAFDRRELPFALFEDCTRGPERRRREAFAANKARRHAILPYLGAWTLRAVAMAASLATADRLRAAGVDATALEALFGTLFACCVALCSVMLVGWAGLSCFEQ